MSVSLLTDRLLGDAVMRRESVWAWIDVTTINCDGGWTSLQKTKGGPENGPRMSASQGMSGMVCSSNGSFSTSKSFDMLASCCCRRCCRCNTVLLLVLHSGGESIVCCPFVAVSRYSPVVDFGWPPDM